MRCASLPIALDKNMRPVRYDAEVGGGNRMEKRSLDLEHAEESWDQWEIHCLILVSLSLQVFLSLTADLRRRSASSVLRTVLWLAYLSADTVAVFVLGHLAVHAQGQSHELVLFWAPFVLVHLGGQDSITAFSKQDNELWTRHLLGLVTQTAVAGYVVSKSSWPDARLRASMVLIFLSGFLKYAGRTYCLYSASPKSLRAQSVESLSGTLLGLKTAQVFRPMPDGEERPFLPGRKDVKEDFEMMFHADSCWEFVSKNDLAISVDDIMLVDTLVNDLAITVAVDKVPDMLKEKDMPERCVAYQYVAACLVQSYQVLYTKAPLLNFTVIADALCSAVMSGHYIIIPIIMTYTLFHYVSTTIALVLFAFVHKERHHSKADITVSYILLVGAIVLDLLPTFTSIISHVTTKPIRPGTVGECAVMSYLSCIQPRGWLTRKQWSEELAQYSMTRRYSTSSVQDYTRCMPFIRKWILKCKPLVGDWCVEFLDLTHTPVTDDLKLFVLDRLLLLQSRRQEWDFASFRGERALRKWIGSRPQVDEPQRSGYDAVHSSLSSRVDFPTSVLIWHIATDICYFSEDNGHDIENDVNTMTKKKMMMLSRELSRYIMYLVFKCDVMLTTNSRLVHNEAHEELVKYLPGIQLEEKKTVMVMFEAMKKAEQQQGSMPPRVARAQDNNDEESANKDGAATSRKSGIKEILKSMEEAIYSPVLPRAYAVAHELICIDDEAGRWELISEVWLEMLFYTAPRCGAAFHYEHLSTGGEFITHVLFLMRRLGPFMPKPGA